MNIDTLRFALLLAGSSVCFAACGSEPNEHSAQPEIRDTDPIVGRWRWTGYAPGPTALEATFNSDHTFAFVLQRAPFSTPAGFPPSAAPGFDPEACFPTLFVNGSYVETAAQGSGLLSWTFTEGTANKVSGCSDPSLDQPGTPLSAEDVSSYIGMGPLPPTTLTFNVTSSELRLLSPVSDSAGVGRGDGTTFLKAL